MRNYYSPSAVEEFITKAYALNKIESPNDLNIDRLSGIWGVSLHFTNTNKAFAQWNSSTACIFLPENIPFANQRVAFFHELCHVLRHAGNQRIMTKEFRDLQEDQAEQFVLFASMPFFMLRDYLEQPTSVIAEEFKMPIEYVHKRLEYIQRRIQQNAELGIYEGKPRWSPETIKVLHQLNHILLNKQHYRYYGA